MNRDRAKRFFQILLVSATGSVATVACGGGVAPSGGQGGSGPFGTSAEDPGGEERPPTTPRRDASTFEPDAAFDAPPDVRSDVTTQSCITGVEDAKPGLCCDTPNDPQCGPGGGGGDVACQLDCRKVCADVAPGVQGGFENCYWGTGVNAGKIQYVCGACGVGRIPGDLAPCDEGTTVGERLAMQAYYEAASVVAFERLAATLEASGAPSALVSRARRAAEEERAHAALFAKLARERGATVPALRFQPASESEPDLNALAVENATEGCVRETYGALVAMHQGLHAAEPAVRAAFASVADDEIDHAALSWELTAWLEARMPSEARAHVVASRAAAQRELRRSLQRFLTPIERALGLPEREVALSMFDAIVLSGAALSEAA